jgi:UDP-N-acetylglucosamine 2-epimerase
VTHIAYLIGTRPEAIRSARLLQLVVARADMRLTLINTGQHYDRNMLDVFLEELNVPAVGADLKLGRAEPAAQTGEVAIATAGVLRETSPDVLCVFGDTNSSLGGALAAVKVGVPLVHIEAGCRSFDMQMPEEINRRLIDHMAGLLLAVSEVSRQNLEAEKVRGRIEVVGDPQYDVFLAESNHSPLPAPERAQGLLTLHRPQNVDDPDQLAEIVRELDVSSQETGLRWMFPVHPRTRRSLGDAPSSIELLDPQPYRSLLGLLRQSRVCVTDSGGLQKEALWMEVPCVTIRDTSEWLETLWQGVNVLAPAGSDIAGAVQQSLPPNPDRDFSNPYGDGRACEQILTAIEDWVEDGARFASPPDVAELTEPGALPWL